MKESQREALVLDFVRRLKDAGSWCGETHIQKSTYFLQELMGVPLDFNYTFYKHGPFSFDLNDQLTALRGNALLDLRSHPPYGPHVHATAAAVDYLKQFPVTLAQYESACQFVVAKLAAKNVAELERLSTALYVRLEMPEGDDRVRAERMNELKPHVSIQEARNALHEVAGFEQESLSWARRPLAACRAVICAALWPDPADEHCPQSFRDAAKGHLVAFAKRVNPEKINAEKQQLQATLSTESRAQWELFAKGDPPLDPKDPAHQNVLRFALLDFIADFANWDNSTVPAYLETSRALTQAAHEALGGEPGTRPMVVDPFAGGGHPARSLARRR